jgi:hypothetical protein
VGELPSSAGRGTCSPKVLDSPDRDIVEYDGPGHESREAGGNGRDLSVDVCHPCLGFPPANEAYLLFGDIVEVKGHGPGGPNRVRAYPVQLEPLEPNCSPERCALQDLAHVFGYHVCTGGYEAEHGVCVVGVRAAQGIETPGDRLNGAKVSWHSFVVKGCVSAAVLLVGQF